VRSPLLPAAALLALLAGPAAAAPGFATGAVNLRAGPGTGYPQVVVVPAGAPVEIFGCLDGRGWCDVGYGSVRGWVSANYLQSLREDRRVPLPALAPDAGVPVVTFSFGDYWGSHYRDRPWFAERDRWGAPPPHPAHAPPPWRGPEEEWRRERREAVRDRRDDRREDREWRREREWRERERDRRDDRREAREDYRGRPY